MVLVRENLIIHRCPDLETSCELLWIELSTKKGPMLFGVYYLPLKVMCLGVKQFLTFFASEL